MITSSGRPAGARHTANAVPRLTPEGPTPVEVALRARIAELEAENEGLLATNTALWGKIAEQDRKLGVPRDMLGEWVQR